MGWKDAPLRAAPKTAARWASAPLKEAAKDERGVLHRAAVNAPGSAKRFVGGIVDAVTHPVQTVETLGELATGAVQHALPEGMQAASAAGQRAKAAAVGGYFDEHVQPAGGGCVFIDVLNR